MKLIAFGATGGTGNALLAQGLARGHEFRVLVRDPARLGELRDRVEVLQGDLLQPESLEPVFAAAADAVVMTTGVYHREPRTELSDGTRNVVRLMQQHGPKRLVVLTSLGCGDSRGQGNLVARFFQRLFLTEVLADKDRQEQLIRDTSLDWTFVRPPQLVNKAAIQEEVAQWQGPPPQGLRLTWRTSRATVAHFMLDTLEQQRYSREAVSLSETR